jgi:Leucine Rich Repeat
MALEHLNLSHNQLEIANMAFYEKTKKLRKLDLSNNQIATIPYYVTYENFINHSLELLNLGHNHLKFIDFGRLPNFTNLKEMDLRNNQLESLIIADLAQRFPKLKEINIIDHRLNTSTLLFFFAYCDQHEIHETSSAMTNTVYAIIFAIIIAIGCFVSFSIWVSNYILKYFGCK